MKKPIYCAWTTSLLLAGCLSGWAQRTPAPAASSGPISAIGASGEASPTPQETGEQDISDLSAASVKLPSIGGRPQLLTYGLSLMQVVNTNTLQVSGSNSVQSGTLISGNTTLDRQWGRNRLTLGYNGAESIFAGGGGGTHVTSTHQVNFSSFMTKQRWQLGLSELASYAPQSSYGLGLYGGLGSDLLGFGSGYRSGFSPNESILNSGNRINNSVIANVGYQLSPLSTLQVSGEYGILRFLGSGLADSSQYNFGLGLSRVLSPRSNLSLNYTFFRTTSSGFAAVQTHSALLGYTRRFSPRLMLQVSAGPQVQVRAQAQASPVLSNSVQWTTSNDLLYQLARGSSLSLEYSAGIIGGAGIYGASRNHNVSVDLSRPILRFWNASFIAGYSQNSAVESSSRTRAQHGGVFLRRTVQGKGLSFSYQFSHQSATGGCFGLACSVFGGWTHTAGVGLDWVFRPVRLD